MENKANDDNVSLDSVRGTDDVFCPERNRTAGFRFTAQATGVHSIAAREMTLIRRILAALDRQLDALVTFVYCPLPLDEYRVGVGARLDVLLLFTALALIGVAAQ